RDHHQRSGAARHGELSRRDRLPERRRGGEGPRRARSSRREVRERADRERFAVDRGWRLARKAFPRARPHRVGASDAGGGGAGPLIQSIPRIPSRSTRRHPRRARGDHLAFYLKARASAGGVTAAPTQAAGPSPRTTIASIAKYSGSPSESTSAAVPRF